MGKEGRSFFERLTGTVNVDDFEEEEQEILDPDELDMSEVPSRHFPGKPKQPRGRELATNSRSNQTRS